MRVWLFLFLYGAATLIGAFLTAFWFQFAYSRWMTVSRKIQHDKAFVLSMSVALLALGLTITDGARLVGNAQFGLSKILLRNEGYWIAAGLVTSIIGMLLLVWLADLEKHPPRWNWLRGGIGLTMLWAVGAFMLAQEVPFGG